MSASHYAAISDQNYPISTTVYNDDPIMSLTKIDIKTNAPINYLKQALDQREILTEMREARIKQIREEAERSSTTSTKSLPRQLKEKMDEALLEAEKDYKKGMEILDDMYGYVMTDTEKESLEITWKEVAMNSNYNEPIQKVEPNYLPEKTNMLKDYEEVRRRKFTKDFFMPLSKMELDRLPVGCIQTIPTEGDDDGTLMRNMTLTTKYDYSRLLEPLSEHWET